MANTSLAAVLRHLHRVAGADRASDADLLDQFASRRDESAFGVLVCRHGPMVLGLCQRVLRHEQDSEDVFQATFLTLARKAASIGKKEALASWFYKVAYRIACRARAARPVATNRSELLDAVPAPAIVADAIGRELRLVLDQEISRLPESYRRAIVLCYLEGKTHEETAELLGCPIGTVAARLARARQRLGARLTRRGCTLSAAALGTVLADKSLAGAVPAALARVTAQSALAFVSGKTAAAGVLSAKAVVLAEGVLQMMWYSKVKMLVAVILMVALTGSGVGLAVREVWAGGAGEGPRAEQTVAAAQDPAPATAAPAGDAKPDIAVLRAEMAKLRADLELAMKEIKRLNDTLREGAVPPDRVPTYKGKPASFWLNQFNDADHATRLEAVKALGALVPKNKELIPTLLAALKEPATSRETRIQPIGSTAAKALGRLGPDVVPQLLAVLKDKTSRSGQIHAAQALGAIGPDAKAAIPLLGLALNNDDLTLRGTAIKTLGEIGPDAKTVLPVLVNILEQSLKDVNFNAKTPDDRVFSLNDPFAIVEALLKIDPTSRNVLPKNMQKNLPPDTRRGYLAVDVEDWQEAPEGLRIHRRFQGYLAVDVEDWQEALEALKKRYVKANQ